MTTFKDSLDPAVKRAAKKDVSKILRERKKEEVKKPMAKKTKDDEEVVKKNRTSSSIDLSDVVKLKKQKAVANELDEYIYEQEQKKNARERGEAPPATKEAPNPIAMALASDPSKVAEMDMDDIMKFSMLTGGSKANIDPLMYMMLMGNKEKGGEQTIMQQLMTKIILDKFDDKTPKNQPDSSQDMMFKFMIIMMQNIMNAQNQKTSQPTQPSAGSPLEQKLVELVALQNRNEKQILMDKIKELEYRTSQSDPLGDAKRMLDYVKTFGSMFGGARTPEVMTHELEMEKLKFEKDKEARTEAIKEQRMAQVGDMINKSIGTFAEVLSKPAAEAVKGKLDNIGREKPARYGETQYEAGYGEEVDLDQFDMEEDEMPYPPEPHYEPRDPKNKKGRMRIYSSD